VTGGLTENKAMNLNINVPKGTASNEPTTATQMPQENARKL